MLIAHRRIKYSDQNTISATGYIDLYPYPYLLSLTDTVRITSNVTDMYPCAALIEDALEILTHRLVLRRLVLRRRHNSDRAKGYKIQLFLKMLILTTSQLHTTNNISFARIC